MIRGRTFGRLYRGIIIAAVLWFSEHTLWAVPPPTVSNVLMLYSFRKDSPGIALLDEEIRKAIAVREGIQYHAEYMDVPIFKEEEQSRLLHQYLKDKYRDRKVDVFIAYGNPAIKFLISHGKDVFGDTCFLAFAAQDELLLRELRELHVPGAYFSYEIRRSVETALKLFPATRNVAVVAGTAPEDQPALATAQEAEKEFKGRLTFTYVTKLPIESTLERVRNLPEHSVVLYTTFAMDSTGATFLPVDVGAKIVSAATVPVFGVIDSFLGRGILGGWTYDVAANGALIGRLVLSALDGTASADRAEIVSAISVPTFDYRMLQNWKISEATLPPGSVIRFKPAALWQKSRSVTAALAVAVIASQVALVRILIAERERRRKKHNELRAMEERVLKVQEEERRRIARELHDGTAQSVFAISLNLTSLEQAVSPSVLRERLVECAALCERSLKELRLISYLHHPPELDGRGFESAVRSYTLGFSKRTNIEITVDLDQALGQFPSALERDLFRIIQESLTNVFRHSGGNAAAVRVVTQENDVVLQVTDNGKGMPPAVVATGLREAMQMVGVGISGMRERVRQLGGQLSIESGTKGTTLTVTVPRVRPDARKA